MTVPQESPTNSSTECQSISILRLGVLEPQAATAIAAQGINLAAWQSALVLEVSPAEAGHSIAHKILQALPDLELGALLMVGPKAMLVITGHTPDLFNDAITLLENIAPLDQNLGATGDIMNLGLIEKITDSHAVFLNRTAKINLVFANENVLILKVMPAIYGLSFVQSLECSGTQLELVSLNFLGPQGELVVKGPLKQLHKLTQSLGSNG